LASSASSAGFSASAPDALKTLMVNDGESAVGVRTVAVPILDRAARVRFALAVRATPEVITEAKIPWTVSRARACVAAIQVHLLFPEERPGQDEPA